MSGVSSLNRGDARATQRSRIDECMTGCIAPQWPLCLKPGRATILSELAIVRNACRSTNLLLGMKKDNSNSLVRLFPSDKISGACVRSSMQPHVGVDSDSLSLIV